MVDNTKTVRKIQVYNAFRFECLQFFASLTSSYAAADVLGGLLTNEGLADDRLGERKTRKAGIRCSTAVFDVFVNAN